MKKYITIISVLFVGCFILMACSNDNGNQNNEGAAEENNNTEDNDLVNDNVEDNNDVDDSADGDWGEDELGLGIGDTATLNNNFSNTEVTLDSVEVIDDEDDETYSGQYTVLNMTVKNIGDEPVDFLDVFETTELVAGEEDGGTMWDLYDEFSDDWPDEIDVGKEASGPLVYDVEDVKEYEVQIDYGLTSVANKASFKFTEDEIE